jgi:hypothetical protein
MHKRNRETPVFAFYNERKITLNWLVDWLYLLDKTGKSMVKYWYEN